MGSFTDLVLSFNFRRDTPPEVLAAFSKLAQPRPDGKPAPALPQPVVEPDEFWDPEWRNWGGGFVDPMVDEPWRHDWAAWMSDSASFATVPSAALVWNDGMWNFASRSCFKTDAESIFAFIEWLGPFVHGYGERQLLGYLHGEYDDRPHLIWHDDGRMVREDLN